MCSPKSPANRDLRLILDTSAEDLMDFNLEITERSVEHFREFLDTFWTGREAGKGILNRKSSVKISLIRSTFPRSNTSRNSRLAAAIASSTLTSVMVSFRGPGTLSKTLGPSLVASQLLLSRYSFYLVTEASRECHHRSSTKTSSGRPALHHILLDWWAA